ncbi:MAG: rRNA maturation RNase YbeY [Desulfovibrionaceae bacterium]|nr:rRNA maturation RNase YbeY [Desulfovibrionaceae bacterium]
MMPRVVGSPFSPFSRQEWATWLDAMLRVAAGAAQPPAVELVLMRDGGIAALNRAHLGCTGPTNILSFPDSADAGRLGSLALSVDSLRRECRLYGQSPAEYARRLLAHGLAHLCGYDHGPLMDAACAELEAAAARAPDGAAGGTAGLDAACLV